MCGVRTHTYQIQTEGMRVVSVRTYITFLQNRGYMCSVRTHTYQIQTCYMCGVRTHKYHIFTKQRLYV